MFKNVISGSILGLALVSSGAQAIEAGFDVSRHSTNLNLGLGTASPGLFLKGNWLRSDHDGKAYDLGVGYNLDIGSLRLAPAAKLLYAQPKDGHDGLAVALGASALYRFNTMWGLYGDYYYSPQHFADRLHSYTDVSGGLNFSPISLLDLRAGYRYVKLDNKGNQPNNVLVDGPYLGASLHF